MNSSVAVIEFAPGRATRIVDALQQSGLPRLQAVMLPVHAGRQELPPDTAAVIGSGGPGSVLELDIDGRSRSARILRRGLALFNQTRAKMIPILGICLSHQLLAVGAGGLVCRRLAGPAAGFETIRLDCDDELFADIPGSLSLAQFHHDQVQQPPPGWKVLARSESCEIEAMRMEGCAVWSVQGHPELPAEFLKELLRSHGRASGGLAAAPGSEYDMQRLKLFQNFLAACRNGATC